MDSALRLGMKGPAVRRYQELCDLVGCDAGPNDGVFGPAVNRMTKHIQSVLDVPADGIVGPVTWKALMRSIRGGIPQRYLPSGVISIAHTHPPPKNFGYLRGWGIISGVVLHQTGCEMPRSLYGWSRVNAHYGITQEGVAVCINDPMDMIWHAQRLSKTTIGIEIEGNYQGLEDNPNTLWRPGGGPHTLNKKMLEAADAIFAELAFQFKRSGAEWKHVWAHRQSSASRRRDPGQEIWTHIGRDWMEALGLSSESLGRSHGTGCPIPKQWDREGEGEY